MANSKINPVYLRFSVSESRVWLFGAYDSLEEAIAELDLYECIVEVRGKEKQVVAGKMVGDALILNR